ncbi:MAG: hypothetical protein M1827_002976 [Pycnora praestabilis]|nr:MAG: hypothetical protein M1827_002976 [Pycnora praestabilis]
MDMDVGMGGSMASGPLSDAGLDMANMTVASDFLAEVLDDSDLQPMDIDVSRAFWYGIVIVIAVVAAANVLQWATLKARLRAAASKRIRPASPSNPVTSFIATLTAVGREISYPQFTPMWKSSLFRVPPTGTILLLLTYLGFVLGLEYFRVFITGAQRDQAMSLRAAWLSVAQLPLIVLLAGKNNLVGLATGVSYERLNVLHRWVARTLFLTATLHWAYQQYGWSLYGLVSLERSTDYCVPTGTAAWVLLLWINLSTLAPIRNRFYEFFVIQHILTFIGFLIAVAIHVPVTYARIYIYIPSGLYIIDRLVRTIRLGYNNSKGSRATVISLSGNVSKIHIRQSRIKNWKPGQHVFLSIPHFGKLQSHPATIASIPTSHEQDLVFILKAHKGFTNRIMQSASSSTTSLIPSKEKLAEPSTLVSSFVALVDGPYGASQSDFAAFDTALLISASTGVTFTLPILLNIAHRAETQRLPVRRLDFVWIVRSSTWTTWIAQELRDAVEKLHNAGIEVKINIFVTCDETFVDDASEKGQSSKKPGCRCASSTGPCCCSKTDTSDSISSVEPGAGKVPNPASLSNIATISSGRPDLESLLWALLDTAEGETGVAVCGPLGLSSNMRRIVASVSNQRAVHKGTGAEGIYLHAESYGW